MKSNIKRFSYSKGVSMLLLFLTFGTVVHSQAQPKLYNSLTKLGPKSENFFMANNIPTAVTVSSRYFAPNNNNLAIDYNLFSRSIKMWFPDYSSKGIAVLDWEGLMTTGLYSNPNLQSFKYALSQYIALVKYAKKIRPNVKWGCYGYPFTSYGDLDYRFQQKNLNILPLLKECDILFPSLYIRKQKRIQDRSIDIAYCQTNMTECLKLGYMVKKPVLPYVWKRYNNNGKIMGFQLVPVNDLTAFVKTILNTSYMGQKAAGVVWWGADVDFYNTKTPQVLQEYGNSKMKNFKDYDDNLIVQYGTQMLKAVNGN